MCPRAALFALLILAAGCSASDDAPLNVVFILADDLGYMDVGAFNPDTFYDTPNLNSFAASGMKFVAAYAASPVCSPTRASIMTGKTPARLKTTDWFGAPQPENVAGHWTRDKPLLPAPYLETLPHDEITIAEALRSAGYRTFFAGKWHLGTEGSYPEDHGFDINKGGWERGGPYGGNRYFSPYGNPKLEDGPEGEHLPDRLARETAQFIREAGRSGEAFFAFLSFYSVHTPLMARADLQAKYEARAVGIEDAWGMEGERQVRLVQNHAVYAGMVEAMDEAVGVVLDALDETGLAQNTLVIFMSDNGGLSTSEGHPTSNVPLRAGKGWMYEGGIREPMIVRWAGVTRPGTTANTPVLSTDFYPTILDAAGVAAGAKSADGQSMLPLLRGEAGDESRSLFWHYPHYGNQGGSPASAVRSGRWKLIRFYEGRREELYDLETDVGEMTDLAARETSIREELSARLDAWLAEVEAELPTPNPGAAASAGY